MAEIISKEQFLIEHNKLSPKSLKATLSLLNRFKEEKRPLLKDNGWCLDKLRIPFISWLTALSKPSAYAKALAEKGKKSAGKSGEKEIFKNYPETHYEG